LNLPEDGVVAEGDGVVGLGVGGFWLGDDVVPLLGFGIAVVGGGVGTRVGAFLEKNRLLN
jgi:hypothetical protein